MVVATDDARDPLALVATWRHVLRLPPLVVLVPGAAPVLRRRAFALGAADVIGWPGDPVEVGARLAVLLPQGQRDSRTPSRCPPAAHALP